MALMIVLTDIRHLPFLANADHIQRAVPHQANVGCVIYWDDDSTSTDVQETIWDIQKLIEEAGGRSKD